MSENTNTTAENIIPIPAEAPSVEATDSRSHTIQEVVDQVDISNLTLHDLYQDQVASIQKLALGQTIGLGLASRILERDAANEKAASDNADAESSK